MILKDIYNESRERSKGKEPVSTVLGRLEYRCVSLGGGENKPSGRQAQSRERHTAFCPQEYSPTGILDYVLNGVRKG